MRSDTSPVEAIKESGPSADVMEVPVIDREVILATMWSDDEWPSGISDRALALAWPRGLRWPTMWTARKIVHQWFSLDGYASGDSAYVERGTTI